MSWNHLAAAARYRRIVVCNPRLQYTTLLFLLLANLLSLQQRRSGNWFQEVSRSLKRDPSVDATSPSSQVLTPTTSFTQQRYLHNAATTTGAVHDNTTWIGNQWIPPSGYRLFSVFEMQKYFTSSTPSASTQLNHSMLFLGDSSARRVYATFFAILNTTTTTMSSPTLDSWDVDAAHIIDVNKHALTEVCSTKNATLCRRLKPWNQKDNQKDDYHPEMESNTAAHGDGGYHQFDYQQASCPEDILKLDLERLVQEYSLILIHLGAWHLMMKCRSKRMDDFRLLLWKLESFQHHQSTSNVTTVWITMGSIGHENDVNGKRTFKRAHDINTKIRQHVEETYQLQQKQQIQQQMQDLGNATIGPRRTSLTVLDWGSVVQHRSWPYQDRIHGDIAPHYGLEARLVLIQMLMNHLIALRWR